MSYDNKIKDDGSLPMPGKGLRSFLGITAAMDARQQVLFQSKNGAEPNPLMQIIGQWPGDESDTEFEQLLKDIG